MKILVTGIAGFIGSKISNKLIELGHDVVGIDDLSNGKKSNIPKRCRFIKLDLSNYEALSKIKIKFDQIYHLAGQSSGEKSFENPESDLKKNTVTTINLIKFSRKTGVKKFLYASSQSVYGKVEKRPIRESHHTKPLSCYGTSKLASENYLSLFKDQLNYVIFRINNVYGFGQDLKNLKQGMVSIYLAQALTNKKILVKGSLSRFRDFIHIDDVVDCWIKASLDNKVKNKTFNLATGKKTTVKQILKIICKEIKGTKVVSGKNTPGDQKGIYMNIDHLKKRLNKKQFIKIEIGLKKLIKEYLK
tara:strand:- start:1844 stop:2752 length:909 start_codon:yes stop_codon:yes gene_type:complete